MFRAMRRSGQEASAEEVAEILRTEKRGVLAVCGDDGYPYAVPVDFYYDETEETIYIHSAREGHKVDSIRRCPKVCFTVRNSGYTKEDWSYHLTSVVVFGKAELVNVSDTERIHEKLLCLGNKYYPTEAEVLAEIERASHRVQLIAVHAEHITGKHVHEK